MSGSKFCAVCNTNSSSNLIKFPTDEALREKWIEKTGVKPKNETDTLTRICRVHFAERDWDYTLTATDSVLKTLKSDAVPSLFVGLHAPVPDVIIPPPPSHRRKRVRCAVCNAQCYANDAVAVFENGLYYTDFGVALAIVLQLSSRVLMSRQCCWECSKLTMKCFELMVELNVSTLLTTRMLKTHEERKNSKAQSDEEGEPNTKIDQSALKCVKSLQNLDGVDGRCTKCDGEFHTVPKFTDHFLTHIFSENHQVIRKTVAITQTDEIELEMGVHDVFADDEDDESVTNKKRDSTKKKKIANKKKEKIIPPEEDVNEYIVEYLDEDFFEDYLEPEPNEGNPPDIPTPKVEMGDDLEIYHMRMPNLDDDSRNEMAIEILEDEIELVNFDPGHHFDLEPTEDNVQDVIVKDEVLRKEPEEGLSDEENYVPKKKKKKRQTGTDTGPRVCHVCGAVLKHLKSYLVHMANHDTPRRNYKTCENCGLVRGNMSQHKKTCQRQLERSTVEKERKTSSSTCGICGKNFADFYLPKHLLLHEIEEDMAVNGPAVLDKYLQSCTLCGKRVKHLNEHMKKSHKWGPQEFKMNDMVNTAETLPTFCCDHCGQNFMQRPLFVIHLVLKHGLDPRHLNSRGSWSAKTPWTCSVCDVTFLTYNNIRKHTRENHNGIGLDLECEMCKKRYNCLRSLRAHVNTKHINYFKYRCTTCDVYFVKEESAKEHYTFRCKANVGGRKRSKKHPGENPNPKRRGKNAIQQLEDITVITEEVRVDDEEYAYVTQ